MIEGGERQAETFCVGESARSSARARARDDGRRKGGSSDGRSTLRLPNRSLLRVTNGDECALAAVRKFLARRGLRYFTKT